MVTYFLPLRNQLYEFNNLGACPKVIFEKGQNRNHSTVGDVGRMVAGLCREARQIKLYRDHQGKGANGTNNL